MVYFGTMCFLMLSALHYKQFKAAHLLGTNFVTLVQRAHVVSYTVALLADNDEVALNCCTMLFQFQKFDFIFYIFDISEVPYSLFLFLFGLWFAYATYDYEEKAIVYMFAIQSSLHNPSFCA